MSGFSLSLAFVTSFLYHPSSLESQAGGGTQQLVLCRLPCLLLIWWRLGEMTGDLNRGLWAELALEAWAASCTRDLSCRGLVMGKVTLG